MNTTPNNRKFNQRLYDKMLDPECTFQPDLNKMVSKSTKKFVTINDDEAAKNTLEPSDKKY
jgi:hypothetical protein